MSSISPQGYQINQPGHRAVARTVVPTTQSQKTRMRKDKENKIALLMSRRDQCLNECYLQFDGEILEVTEACANTLNLTRACVANSDGSCEHCGKVMYQDREYQNPNNRGGRRKTRRKKKMRKKRHKKKTKERRKYKRKK